MQWLFQRPELFIPLMGIGLAFAAFCLYKATVQANIQKSQAVLRELELNRDRDGSTPEKAIIVSGVAAEYEWMARLHPGFQPSSQALCEVDGKPFDVLTWRNAQGDERVVYFDISRFFGRLL